MARLFQVGDRVVVIYEDPCCHNTVDVGYIFTIKKITNDVDGVCHECGAVFVNKVVAWSGVVNTGGCRQGFLVDNLQLIPPTPALIREREVIQ